MGCASLAISFLAAERGKFDDKLLDGNYKYSAPLNACLVDVRMVDLPTHWESRYIVDLMTNEHLAFYAGSTDPAQMQPEQHTRQFAFDQKEIILFGGDEELLRTKLKLDQVK